MNAHTYADIQIETHICVLAFGRGELILVCHVADAAPTQPTH